MVDANTGSPITLAPIEEDLPVESAPETPAEELRSELLPRPSAQAQIEFIGSSLSDYSAALIDRSEWEQRLADWDNLYYGDLPEKMFPWAGASNLHIPITMLGVETLKPRLTEAVLGEDPPLMVVPVESADEELRDRVELFLNWQLRSELGLSDKVVQASHLFLNPGTVIAKVFWRVERRRKKYIRHYDSGTDATIIMDDLFGSAVPKWDDIDGDTWRGTITTTPTAGAPLEVELTTKVLEDGIQVLVSREVVSERPSVELLDPIDFIAPANGGQHLQRLPWCTQRLWLFEEDLRRKVKLGRFYADAVEALLTPSEPAGDGEQSDSSDVRAGRAEAEGVTDLGESNVRGTQYEVLEEYRSWDIDGDGMLEEIIVWWCPQLKDQILGWDYLDNLYPHGKRPFVVGRYAPIPFKFYGLSFPAIVQGLQEEINSIHNQRVDYGTVQNMPWYFFRASATHSPSIYKLRPGEGVPIDDPQKDIMIPQFRGNPQFGQAEEALIYQYFERLTGLTDLALGRQPNRVGATRTATGVASLLSEAGLRFKTSMQAFQRFWTEVFEQILALDQAYLPPGVEFRVTGKAPEIIKLRNRDAIAGRFDIRLSATTETLNRQVMREDATIKLQTMMNPVFLQLGLIGQRGINKALRNFLKAYGETNPENYLENPEPAVVRTPSEELAIWVNGGDVQPHPAENLSQHIMEHSVQLRLPDVQKAGRAITAKIEQHLGATIQIQQAMQVAMAAGGGGGEGGPSMATGPQAMNAQVGRTAPNQPATRSNMNPTPEMMGGPGGTRPTTV